MSNNNVNNLLLINNMGCSDEYIHRYGDLVELIKIQVEIAELIIDYCI